MHKALLAVSLLLIPSAAFSENILRQRIGDIGNRVESVFTDNPAAHEEKTLKDRRKLVVNLIEKNLREIESMRFEIEQIDGDLSRIIPGYFPTPVPGHVGAQTVTPLVGSLAPLPIQTCVIDAAGRTQDCQ